VGGKNLRGAAVTPINSTNNIKESLKKKTPIISPLKKETLTIKAVIKNEVVILKRGSFRLGFIRWV